MRVDVGRVMPARRQDIDPEAVGLPGAAAHVQIEAAGKSCNMRPDDRSQFRHNRRTPRQIVERGIGGVALIAVRPRPGLPGFVFGSDPTAFGPDFAVQARVTRTDFGAVERGCKEGRDGGHARGLAAVRGCRQSNSATKITAT